MTPNTQDTFLNSVQFRKGTSCARNMPEGQNMAAPLTDHADPVNTTAAVPDADGQFQHVFPVPPPPSPEELQALVRPPGPLAPNGPVQQQQPIVQERQEQEHEEDVSRRNSTTLLTAAPNLPPRVFYL